MDIYTDGATSGNGTSNARGGWAFVVPELRVQGFGHVANATNQICELMAAINACKFAEKISTSEIIVIKSDSAYLVNCYNQEWWRNWEKNGWVNSTKKPVANQNLWKDLIYFFTNPKFTFEKVKGHSNDKYNELADSLAVFAKNNKEEIYKLEQII